MHFGEENRKYGQMKSPWDRVWNRENMNEGLEWKQSQEIKADNLRNLISQDGN